MPTKPVAKRWPDLPAVLAAQLLQAGEQKQYEAAAPDEVARYTKVRYLTVGVEMSCEKSADGIVGRVTSRRGQGGPANVREPEASQLLKA